MKSRTIIMTTAAIITVSAVILSIGLTLLHSSAMGEEPVSQESIIPVSEAPVDGTAENAEDEVDIHDYPVIDGGEFENDGVTPADKGVVIDIFENATGKLVGQLVIDSDPIHREIREQFHNAVLEDNLMFNPCIPEEAEPVCLPEAKYRVEVYCGVWFSYSYGIENNDMVEFTQTGLTLAGGKEVIAYIDSFIADEISAIEAGTAETPAPETAMSVLTGLESYWNGCYHETTGEWFDGIERFTPRFPYLKG